MGFSQGIMPNKSSWTHGQLDVTAAGTAEPLTKLALAGTLTFTNGSTAVTGVGTAFSTELEAGDDISLDADAVWAVVSSVTDDENLVLTAVYSGTGGSGAGSTIESVPVPDGCQLTIIAKPGNGTGIIYTGNTQARAEGAAYQFDGIEAGLAKSMQVNDANQVWVDADTSGIGVSYYVEQ